MPLSPHAERLLKVLEARPDLADEIRPHLAKAPRTPKAPPPAVHGWDTGFEVDAKYLKKCLGGEYTGVLLSPTGVLLVEVSDTLRATPLGQATQWPPHPNSAFTIKTETLKSVVSTCSGLLRFDVHPSHVQVSGAASWQFPLDDPGMPRKMIRDTLLAPAPTYVDEHQAHDLARALQWCAPHASTNEARIPAATSLWTEGDRLVATDSVTVAWANFDLPGPPVADDFQFRIRAQDVPHVLHVLKEPCHVGVSNRGTWFKGVGGTAAYAPRSPHQGPVLNVPQFLTGDVGSVTIPRGMSGQELKSFLSILDAGWCVDVKTTGAWVSADRGVRYLPGLTSTLQGEHLFHTGIFRALAPTGGTLAYGKAKKNGYLYWEGDGLGILSVQVRGT